MKFYHFTQTRRLAKIRKEGLRAVPKSKRNFFMPQKNCLLPDRADTIWLTTQDRNPHSYFNIVCDARIAIELSLKDKKLFHWETWIRKNMPPEYYTRFVTNRRHDDESWQDFWFYAGRISPNKFIGVHTIAWPDTITTLRSFLDLADFENYDANVMEMESRRHEE